jgi:hypothetical protein
VEPRARSRLIPGPDGAVFLGRLPAITFEALYEEGRMAAQRRKRPRRTTASSLPPYQPEAFLPEFDMFAPDVALKTGRRALAVQWGFVEELLRDPRVVQRMRGWIERGLKGRLDCDDVLELVRDDLGLRWSWCVREIIDAFVRMVDGIKEPIAEPDHPGTVRLKIPESHAVFGSQAEAAIHAPPLAVGFWTEDGEGVEDALKRWDALDAAVRTELAEAANAGGANTKAKEGAPHLRSWGRWYYLHRVACPPQRRSINAIAKENRKSRTDVRDAIREAERLLGLLGLTFPLGGKRRP